MLYGIKLKKYDVMGRGKRNVIFKSISNLNREKIKIIDMYTEIEWLHKILKLKIITI